MTSVEVTTHVDANGVLRLEVPLGRQTEKMIVTIKPASLVPAKAPPRTKEEWLKFIADTAGSITDPTFVRHPQGELENLSIEDWQLNTGT
jgi:hypothetical protein